MKFTLILFLLPLLAFAQFKVDVKPAATTAVTSATAATGITARPVFISGPIKVCRYQNLGEPCILVKEETSPGALTWDNGESMVKIGSVQVTDNFYSAQMLGFKSGSTPYGKTVYKKDGVINFSSTLRFARIKVKTAPLRVCSQRDLKGNCEYLWKSLFDPFATNASFNKPISSFAIAEGYEGAFCVGKNLEEPCGNIQGYRRVNNWDNRSFRSVYLREYDENAPIKLCGYRVGSGICVDSYEGDVDLTDGKGIPRRDYHSIVIKDGYEATICTDILMKEGGCYNFTGPKNWSVPSTLKIKSFEVRTKFHNWFSFDYEANFPHDAEVEWGENNQGVAHDDNNWYFTTTKNLMKYPVTKRVMGRPTRKVGLPGSCKHFGDLSHYNGKIYVAMEKCSIPIDTFPGFTSERRIYVYDTNLNVIKYGVLAGKSNASWVAINPQNGLMYSSVFYDGSYGKDINVYDPNFKNGEDIKELYTMKLSHGLKRIQGGAISDNGNLYLVSDNRYSTSNAGIYMYRIEGSKARFVHKIGPNGFSPGFPNYEEMEGITIWNVDDKNAPDITGHIHWTLNVNDAGHDDLYFKHISVDWPQYL